MWAAVASYVLFLVVPVVAHHLLGSAPVYRAWSWQNQLEMTTRLNSQLHALVSVAAALWETVVAPSVPFAESLTGVSPFALAAVQFSLGYFVWDLITCVRFYSVYGAAFTLHAAICTAVYAAASCGVMTRFALVYLLYEGSTFFFNQHWWAKMFRYPTLEMLNGVGIVVSFFLVRVCFGNYYTLVHLYPALAGAWPAAAPAWKGTIALVAAAALVLNGLNAFWFRHIAAAATGRS